MSDKLTIGSVVFSPLSNGPREPGPTFHGTTTVGMLGLTDWKAKHDALEAERDVLRTALQFYAVALGQSKSMDMRVVHQDGGAKARAALAAEVKP